MRTARFAWFFALLCALPLQMAVADDQPFYIEGCVYCDTCQFGFETIATTYIAGAKVKIECKNGTTLRSAFVAEGVTDSKGRYNIRVEGDRQDQLCSATLVSSPLADCNKPDPGRSRATVILTGSNGAVSNHHYANNMGFLRVEPLSGCAALRKHYLSDGDVRAI